MHTDYLRPSVAASVPRRGPAVRYSVSACLYLAARCECCGLEAPQTRFVYEQRRRGNLHGAWWQDHNIHLCCIVCAEVARTATVPLILARKG